MKHASDSHLKVPVDLLKEKLRQKIKFIADALRNVTSATGHECVILRYGWKRQIFILGLKQNQAHSVDSANRWTVSIVRGIVQSDNSQGRKGFCEDCTINSNPRTWWENIWDRCWISPRQRVLSIYRLSLRLVSVSVQTPTIRQFVFVCLSSVFMYLVLL